MLPFKNNYPKPHRGCALILRSTCAPHTHSTTSGLGLPHQRGFTLIEALISLAVIAILLTPLFALYSNLFKSTTTTQNRADRMYAAYNFLLESQRAVITKTGLPTEKKIAHPPLTLHFQHVPVPSESPLSKLKNISLDKVLMEWQDGTHKRTDTLVACVYKAESTS